MQPKVSKSSKPDTAVEIPAVKPKPGRATQPRLMQLFVPHVLRVTLLFIGIFNILIGMTGIFFLDVVLHHDDTLNKPPQCSCVFLNWKIAAYIAGFETLLGTSIVILLAIKQKSRFRILKFWIAFVLTGTVVTTVLAAWNSGNHLVNIFYFVTWLSLHLMQLLCVSDFVRYNEAIRRNVLEFNRRQLEASKKQKVNKIAAHKIKMNQLKAEKEKLAETHKITTIAKSEITSAAMELGNLA